MNTGKPKTEGASPVKMILKPTNKSKKISESEEDERTLQLFEKLRRAEIDSVEKPLQKSFIIRSPSKTKLGSQVQSTSNVGSGRTIPRLELSDLSPTSRKPIEKSYRSSKFVNKFSLLK